MHEVKTHGIKVKEALMGDWKELKKHMFVMYVTKQIKVYFCMQI